MSDIEIFTNNDESDVVTYEKYCEDDDNNVFDPRVAKVRVKWMDDKRIYRDIEFLMDTYLDEMASEILDAFGWDCDHCYGFYSSMKWRVHESKEAYELFFDLSHEDNVKYLGHSHFKGVKFCRVKHAFGSKGKKMQFLFDYGASHRFEIEVKAITDIVDGQTYPNIAASKGDIGEQYPSYG